MSHLYRRFAQYWFINWARKIALGTIAVLVLFLSIVATLSFVGRMLALLSLFAVLIAAGIIIMIEHWYDKVPKTD